MEISLPYCFSTTANFRSLLVGTGSNSISLFFSTCVSPPLHRQPHHPHLQNHHSLQLVFWEYLKASHRNLIFPPQTIKTQDYKQENSASLRPYKAWLCTVCLSLLDEAFLQWGLGKIFLIWLSLEFQKWQAFTAASALVRHEQNIPEYTVQET